jgi:SanA protein
MLKRTLKYIPKVLIYGFIGAIILVISCVLLANMVINRFSENYLYSDIKQIPSNKVGVLLGTSQFRGNGSENLFFTYRISAAVELYNAGKIEFIIISGDNSTLNYNEPMLMKKELVKRGVPEGRIFLDFAGFRTFDSMIRAEKIFGQSQFTVISQEFHNQRAVYIARHNGIDAIAYNAKDVSAYFGFKTMLREKFARVKVFIDMLLGEEPHFLGEKIIVQDTLQYDTIAIDTIQQPLQINTK